MVNSSLKHIVILGAGISGLTTAWFLKKKYGPKIQVTILENTARTGGKIQTIQHEGYLFEWGPHSCRTQGKGVETLKLCEELNLQDQVITANPAAHQRFLYMNRKLTPLPTSVYQLLSSSWLFKILPAIWKDLFTPQRIGEDESIADFTARRLGKKIADQLFDPLVSGIYAGDSQQLSMQACFPHLYLFEQEQGSLIKGMLKAKSSKESCSPFVANCCKSSLFSFRKGMETLPKALTQHLAAQLLLEKEVLSLQNRENKIEILLKDSTLVKADYVISTLPSFALAKLLEKNLIEESKELQSIPHAPIAAVYFGFNKNVLRRKGFGYLIPSSEKEKILGMVWDSCIFPEQNNQLAETRLAVMIGGTKMANFKELTESALIDLSKQALLEHLGIKEEPQAIYLYKEVKAIPQYTIGHLTKIERLTQRIKLKFPTLFLSGLSFSGVSVNDCVANSKVLVDSFSIE